MITISKKVEYSIVFISYLSKNEGKTMPLSEAAKKLTLPYRFLAQLASDLKNGGIVESREGKTGGYYLAKGWQKKNIYDLVEALGENRRMVKCLGGGDCARVHECEIKGLFGKIENSFTGELKKIKLSEV